MTGRFWKLVAAFWAFVRDDSIATADFAIEREKAAQQRIRRAIGLPPLP